MSTLIPQIHPALTLQNRMRRQATTAKRCVFWHQNSKAKDSLKSSNLLESRKKSQLTAVSRRVVLLVNIINGKDSILLQAILENLS